MKGVVILTEGRSGSNWLGSLISGTDTLGISREWFSPHGLGDTPAPATGENLVQDVLIRASTPNGFFAIKLFPAHVHRFDQIYQYDLIHSLNSQHDLLFIRLTREDRIRQAVSYARGLQTNQWTASQKNKIEALYDFETICRCYFMIDRSYSYWESYCDLRKLNHIHFSYEQMLPNPRPFVDAVAAHAGVENVILPKSRHSIQRDEKTEEWVMRFQEELKVSDIVRASTTHRPANRTLSNLARFAGGRHLKPLPYHY